ncbi:uncharacterized protein LOC124167754 isoform X2 [Ischnura elegans]|uniref:uncharacterized protein LOC124167754 isoform X2 n=1 Tax=Ischnura elegans TaxID=197161 RepID=UPI001ED8B810|nr:uncharacterized protein LOC124167754 isoform X2 [Ischnura elegans]
MKIYGNKLIPGIILLSMLTLTLPSGCGGTARANKGHNRPRKPRGNCKTVLMNKLSLEMITTKEIHNGVCSEKEMIKECKLEELKVTHNCFAHHADMVRTLFDATFNFSCKDNETMFNGFIPKDDQTCFATVATAIKQCAKPAEKSWVTDGGMTCEKSETEAELFICKSFYNFSRCVSNVLRGCRSSSPSNTARGIVDHVMNKTFCAKHQHQIYKQLNEQESARGSAAGKVTCEGKGCRATITSSKPGFEATSTTKLHGPASEEASSSPKTEAVSPRTENVHHWGIESKPVFTIGGASSETITVKTIGDRSYYTQTAMKFAKSELRTMNSEASYLRMRVFHLPLASLLALVLRMQ